MRKIIDHTGEVHRMLKGHKLEIIKSYSRRNNTVKFLEDGTIIENRDYGQILKGLIRNPNAPLVYGVGYFGIGKYKSRGSVNDKQTKAYQTWKGMLQRCYSEEYIQKCPSYKNHKVDLIWHNFQVFAEWFENNQIKSFHLDKDILTKGNRVYSPETCCFVPRQINNLFTKSKNNLPTGVNYDEVAKKFRAHLYMKGRLVHLGTFDTVEEAFNAYKIAKEIRIKEVADEWKNKIEVKVYQAMYNWVVEIND